MSIVVKWEINEAQRQQAQTEGVVAVGQSASKYQFELMWKVRVYNIVLFTIQPQCNYRDSNSDSALI